MTASPRSVQIYLVLGLLAVYLAFWKGDGGYLDLRQYLDDAERIWTKGDLALPGPPGAPKQYNPFALGLPFICGPMVGLGSVLNWATGGFLPRRAVVAFSIPLMGILACLLLYEIGRRLSISARVSLFAAVILGLGSPLLSYMRLFYAEVGVTFCVLLALWAYLRLHALEGPKRSSGFYWALLAGAALAGVATCHYGNATLATCLWLAMAVGIACQSGRTRAVRAQFIFALGLVPMLAAIFLLRLNLAHYGHPVPTAYQEIPDRLIHIKFISENLPVLWVWLKRTPWILLALFFCLGLYKRDRFLTLGLLGGFLAQILFWLSFSSLRVFAIRYLMSLTGLLAVGLLFLGTQLSARWPRRGLAYGALVLVLWNVGCFLAGDDGSRSFYTSDTTIGVQCHVWYMRPYKFDWPEHPGTPMGLCQGLILAMLLFLGLFFLLRAAREARNNDQFIIHSEP